MAGKRYKKMWFSLQTMGQCFKASCLSICAIAALVGIQGCHSTVNTSNMTEPVATKATKVSKRDAASYNIELGMGYLQNSNHQLAKTKFLQAMKDQPDWAPVWDAMAYYLEVTGEEETAKKYYLKAIDLDPHSGSTHNNYGTFLCRKGDYKLAEKEFLKAVKDPEYMHTAEAYENAGLCVLGIPDKLLAVQYFQKAVEIDPKRGTSLLELSVLSYEQGQYAKTQAYLDKFLSENDPTAQALWLKIRLAKKLGDTGSIAQNGKILEEKFGKTKEYQAYKRMVGI